MQPIPAIAPHEGDRRLTSPRARIWSAPLAIGPRGAALGTPAHGPRRCRPAPSPRFARAAGVGRPTTRLAPKRSSPSFGAKACLSLLATLVAAPVAHAVTGVSVDGHPDPVVLTVGETVTVRWDTAKPAGNVQYTLVRDISGTGKYDPGYSFTRTNPIVDGGAGDSDPAPGKIAWSFRVEPNIPAGRYVLRLQDFADNSVFVSPVWTVVPQPEPQVISGHVAVVSAGNQAGPPPDAVIWAGTNLQTLVASTSIKPDGSYTLPLPPGTYVLFAEWFGNLSSQRQVVRLVAGQQQSGVDLPLLQGQEVSGTVKVSDQPAADALVQATAANGQIFATRTFDDGTYLLVLPIGQYRMTAPGGSELVTVADGAVDGVDFPAPTPAPTPVVGTIVTVAGNGVSTFGGDGRPAITARLPGPQGLAMDAVGNLYVVDNVVNRVRKVDAKTGIITTVAGSRTIDAIRFLIPQLAVGAGFSGDGGPATAAQLDTPQHIVIDAVGHLYISDLNNYRIRKVDMKSGIITTVAGSGPTGSPTVGAFAGDDGPATGARLNRPQGLALDAAGNLYIADQSNGRVRKVSPEGIITTVAGGGTAALADGAKARDVAFNFPREVAVDGAGNLFVSDSSTRIVKVSPAGIVSLVAGTGTPGFSGDGGPATAGQYNAPFPKMTGDRAGNLYFADTLNDRVRKVSPEGIISTVAGKRRAGIRRGWGASDGGATVTPRGRGDRRGGQSLHL